MKLNKDEQFNITISDNKTGYDAPVKGKGTSQNEDKAKYHTKVYPGTGLTVIGVEIGRAHV